MNQNTNNKQFPQALCVALVLSLGNAKLQAATVHISDGTFNPADWTSEERFDAGLNSVNTLIQQQATGGNPGFFRQTSYSLDHNGSQVYGVAYVLNAFQSTTYTPSLQGAIISLDYAEDQTRLSASWAPAMVGAYSALVQDGKYFIGLGNNFGPTDNSWQTATMTSMTASDFVELDGTNFVLGSHPDFGVSGGTIAFGYARANSTSFDMSLSQGIDNWSFTLNTAPVPEPSQVLLALCGFAALGMRRRQPGHSAF